MKSGVDKEHWKGIEKDLAVFVGLRDGRRKTAPKGWDSWTHIVAPKAAEVVEIRKTLKLSQSQFAGLLFLGTSTIQSWEQGKRKPDTSSAVLLKLVRSPIGRQLVEALKGLHQ